MDRCSCPEPNDGVNLPIRLRAAARVEIDKAYDWHEERLRGLGASFLQRVDDALQGAADLPEQHAEVHGRIRRVLLKRFPYGVFYVVDDDAIVVLAVFHARRDPLVWRGL